VGILDLADDTDSAVDIDTVRTILLPEALRMKTMVADLLLLARADERGIPLIVDEVDLDDIVGAEAQRLRSLGLAKVVAEVSPIRVIGDSGTLTRAVRNLADNASHHATTTIKLSMSEDATAGTATIVVADDGPGVPAEAREKIFDRFYRHDNDRGRHSGGSGLGLPIAAEIARAHGGFITVSDTAGGGATFAFTIRTETTIAPDTGMPAASNAELPLIRQTIAGSAHRTN
jgi:signal transduction histidine kinase